MELSSEISTPEFENLEAASYETILKQIKVQRSTINLLHLQLKKQGTAAVDEILEEKDRIILSLEQQMKQGTLPESTNSTQELEKENDKLSQDLASLRSRGREVEIKYNDHLNELQDKINLLKSKNPGSSVQGASSTLQGGADLELARQEIETLEGELRLSRQQEEFYRNQVDRHRERIHNGEENSDSLSLSTEIEDLRRKLEERDKVILDLRESAMTQDPASSDEKILVDNECLRNKIDILEKEIERQNEKALRVDSKSCGPTLELLNSVLDSYQEARSLSKADGASASLGVLADSLLNMAREFELEPFDALGQEYAAEYHHCVDVVYTTEHPHNSVFRETVQGFSKSQKIFRKANVIVSKNPVHCHSCGDVGTSGSKFCAGCGSKLLLEKTGNTEARFIDDEENSQAYVELGESYLQKREFQFAHDSFVKASTLHPDSAQALIGLARVEESLGRYQEAREVLKKLAMRPGMLDRKLELENRIERKLRIIEELEAII